MYDRANSLMSPLSASMHTTLNARNL